MSTYYIKRAGKLYGPFSFEQVINGINRDIFSARDMISVDRVTWDSVEDFRQSGKFFEAPAAPARHAEMELKKVSDPAPDVVPRQATISVPKSPSGMRMGNPSSRGNGSYGAPGGRSFGQYPVTAATASRPADRLGSAVLVANIMGYILLGIVGILFLLQLGYWIFVLVGIISGTVNDPSAYIGFILGEFAAGILGILRMIFSIIHWPLWIIFTIFGMIALYRAWQTIPREEARTTPGKAVGFLFIPLFNLYWMFVAFYGLAADVNLQAGKAGKRNYASAGGIMLCCILYCISSLFSIVSNVLSFIFWLIAIFLHDSVVAPLFAAICHFVNNVSGNVCLLLSIFLITRPALAAWRLARDRNAA